MIATGFDEENAVLDPPPGMSPEDCEALSVWLGRLEKSGLPAVVVVGNRRKVNWRKSTAPGGCG